MNGFQGLVAALKEYVDENLGSATEVECSFSAVRDALELRVVTTIKGDRVRFDYSYPFWEMAGHSEWRRNPYDAAVPNLEPALDELRLVCRRAFGWRYLFDPIGHAIVIDINGRRI